MNIYLIKIYIKKFKIKYALQKSNLNNHRIPKLWSLGTPSVCTSHCFTYINIVNRTGMFPLMIKGSVNLSTRYFFDNQESK